MSRRRRFIWVILGVVGLGLGGLGLIWASQPVITCANAPRKPVTAVPIQLVTAQDYFDHGDYAYEQGDCQQAVADYTRALTLDDQLAEAYNNRAYIYMIQRNYAAALPDLDRALDLRPDYVNALMNRGDLHNYYYAIDYASAVADYDHVLRVDPRAAEHTSVCGHRLLAENHGWTLAVFVDLITHGAGAGCPAS